MTLPTTTPTGTPRAPRRTLPAAAGVGLALMLALTACGGSDPVEDTSAGAEQGAAESTASSGGTDGGETGGENGSGNENGAGQGGEGSGGAGNGSRCKSSELNFEVQEQPNEARYEKRGMLMITNKGERDCVLPAGWVSMGQPVEGGGFDAIQATKKNYPGTGENITLKPGAVAYEGLGWKSGPGDCPLVQGFAVSWDETWVLTDTAWLESSQGLCAGSFTQGTVQPVRNGVNLP